MIQNTYFHFLKTSCKQLASSSTRALGSGKEILSKYDKSQTETFDEPLILVDENDKPVGKVGKYEAHVNELNKNQPAHRAFSVFMFDEKNRLLLHKRSAKKITFPNYWTNTCCSHPLNIESEKEENENIGIKKAAQRRLKFELGYDLEKPEDLNFVGKILYEAPYDQYWGEKEMDYILLLKVLSEKTKLAINENEISDMGWVTRDNITEFVESKKKMGEKITPWFELILKYKLSTWWDQIATHKPYERFEHKTSVSHGSGSVMTFA